MAKWITLALVALLLFFAGLYAGHSVPFSKVLATGTARSSSPAPFVIQQDAGHTIAASSTNSNPPFALISRAEAVASAEVRTAEFDSLQATMNDDAGVSDNDAPDVAVSDAERAAIRKLIQQHFPNTDSDLAEIWVETYAGMDLDEVNFVLEQKKQTSFELGAGLSISSGSTQASSMGLESIMGPSTSNSISALDADIAVVTTNIRSAYAIGYRRMVVLPEVVEPSTSSIEDKQRKIPSTRFRSFESGLLLKSPIATHVAISNEPSLMFCLKANRVTRRGDFQILPDRRLGIITSIGEFAAEGSTPLPEDAKDIHILQNGAIRFHNASGGVFEAGRITVCSIAHLADLQTSDGVLFLASDPGQLKVLENPDPVLRLNSLEQANVNRVDENLLLEHLKSINNSSL